MPRFNARTFSIDDRTYYWFGGFGAIFRSYERGVKQGDVRVIGDRTFYAYLVYPPNLVFDFSKPEVCWSVLDVTIEEVRNIQQWAFGLD